MLQPQVCLLGIPIHNVSLEEMLQECLSLITESEKDRRSHYVCPLTSSFIAQAHSWNFLSSVHNPELLKIARESEIVFAKGKFLPILSYLLGAPLKESIRTRDLLSQLAQALGSRQKAIFLFGGEEKASKTAAIHMHDHSTSLKIVGISTPTVYIKGEELLYEPERTEIILEQINEANPDVLAINLGTPKEEIWYKRVKRNIRVPLCMGIDNILPDLGQEEAPTSKWTKGFSLERLSQSFGRMGKLFTKNLFNFVKMTYISLPLVIYHNINRLVYALFYQKRDSSDIFKHTFLFLSPYRSIAVIPLPSILDKTNVSSLFQQIEESKIHDTLVFDFQHVRHIQPEGFGLLVQTWRKMRKEKNDLYGIGLSKDIQLLMKMHRVWEFIKEQICDSPEALMARITGKGIPEMLYDAIYQRDNHVVITFFGSINNTVDYGSYLERVTPIISQKDCILNFHFCISIENTGFIFLLKLKKLILQQGKILKVCGLNRNLRRQFHLVDLLDKFEIYQNLHDIPLTP